ncbi:MAG: D-glycerate dehydrogenase [Chloroflexi bacterium]|nr:D-glycerate dehydrogenase [Chloroflexota bacterium]
MGSKERAMLPKVLVTRPLPGDALERLRREPLDLRLWEDEEPPPRPAFLASLSGVEGLLCLLTEGVDEEALAAAGSALRVVSTMAVGYDNIAVAACTRRGIPVGHTPGVLTETTADLAFALLLAAARRVVEAAEYVKAGRWRAWSPTALLGWEVHHATLGIVGLGRIGLEMAKRARGFDMRVLYHSRSRRPEAESALGLTFVPALHELLAATDFVSLHVPLTADTRHLIGAAELRAMKPTAVLINTARGPVVDQRALYAALRAGTIAAAGLDVTDPEPLPAGDPTLALPNVLVLPHIGSASLQTRAKMAAMAVDNLLAGLRGERLPHCVNPEVYR